MYLLQWQNGKKTENKSTLDIISSILKEYMRGTGKCENHFVGLKTKVGEVFVGDEIPYKLVRKVTVFIGA